VTIGKRWWIAAAGTLVLVAVALIARAALSKADVPLYRVEQGEFRRQVTADGTLKASQATPLTTPPNAPQPLKIAWIADDGSYVKRGDLIIGFDPTDFENALADGKIERTTTENNLSKETTQFSATKTNLERDITQAEREIEASKTFQPKDADVFSRYEIIESQIDGDLAEGKREYATDVLDIRGDLSKAERDLLSIEKRKADLAIDKAEKGLSALRVVAPHDGVVVFQRDWSGELPRVGSTVWPGRPVGEIPNLEKMEAEVFVLEADAGGIAEGQKATVIVESNPGASYPATVAKIDKLARPRMRGVPVQYFGVTLALDERDEAVMKPGARTRATIVVDDLQDVFTVPQQSVFEKDGSKIVYRWNGGGFDPVAVEVGASSLGRVVVTKGLAEGDRIALRDPTIEKTEGEPARGNGSGAPGL